MRILAVSRNFLPNLGGLETAADALTSAWAEAGHEVTIATETPAEDGAASQIAILRRPSSPALLAATRRADIVWHNHLSLRAAWPLALAPRPWVVTHQGWLRRADGGITAMHNLKRLVAARAKAIAISTAIAADLKGPSTVIPNPYRDRLFRDLKGPRAFELAFLGRFVSDKGVAVLIEALARLKSAGARPRLLMIGEGPEGARLRADAARLGVAEQIEFAGPRRGEALVEALNSALVLVVPSLYAEPFGIVALEGIASGCAVIASAGGGLPEAVGPCGLTFPNGDVEALAARIVELTADPRRRQALMAGAARHLSGFTAAAVAGRYLELFETAIAEKAQMTLAVISHPSKQGNMYRIPAGAARCGFETQFLTGIYWRGPGAALGALRKVNPAAAARVEALLDRRRLGDLDPALVRRISGPIPELLYRFAGYPAGNWVHDRLAALWLSQRVPKGSRGIFHGFQEAAAASLSAARRRGLRTLLEITLPPSTNPIVAAEHRKLGLEPVPAEPAEPFLTELRRSDYVVAQSQFSALSAIEYGVQPGRIFQMPLGVDVAQFSPAPQPRGDRPFRALFTGQMTIRKGVHHLLEAWSAAARGEDELLFAGYPREPRVLELLRRSSARHRYLGFVPHTRLQEVYRQADLFVFPSLAEGGVYVIYEALACGLPCIVSDRAGSAVRDGVEGFVVPVGDVDVLAERIGRLRDDEGLRRRMAAAARARAERFSWPEFYRRIGILYTEVLARDGAEGYGSADLFER